jgi:hypothetical protein
VQIYLKTAALSEVTVKDFLDGRGEDARQVRRVKFKLHVKRAPLGAPWAGPVAGQTSRRSSAPLAALP